MPKSLPILMGWSLLVWPLLFPLVRIPHCRLIGIILAFLFCLCNIFAFAALVYYHWRQIRREYLKFRGKALKAIRKEPVRAYHLINLSILFFLSVVGAIALFATTIQFWETSKPAQSEVQSQHSPPSIAAKDPPEPTGGNLTVRLESSTVEVEHVVVLLDTSSPDAPYGIGALTDEQGIVSFQNVRFGRYRAIVIFKYTSGKVVIDSSTLHHAGTNSSVLWKISPRQIACKVTALNQFEFRKQDLTASHVNIIDQLATENNARPGNFSFLVLGCTDRCGKPAYNDELAGLRAIEVQKRLAQSFPADSIQIYSMGDRLQAVPDTGRGTPGNRRVVCMTLPEIFKIHRSADL